MAMYYCSRLIFQYLNKGQTCQKSCSSSSEVAVSCFGEVASNDVLGERAREKWALTFCGFFSPLKYGKCLSQIFRYLEVELRNM